MGLGPNPREAFKTLKADMASDQVLALYNPEKETIVVLMQKQPSGDLRPVTYASRSMRSAVMPK